MHSNPFTAAGYDIRDLQTKIEQKADRHEIHSLRGEVDRLQRALHSADTTLDGLRYRCEALEENFRRLDEQYTALLSIREEELRETKAANGQFGEGA